MLDVATVRFLYRVVNPRLPNPYLPWQSNPAGMVVTLLALERTSDQNLLSQTVYDSAGRTMAAIQILPGCTVSRSPNADGKPVYTPEGETCLVSRTYYDNLDRVKVSVQNLTGQPVDESYGMPPAYNPVYPDQNVPGSQSAYDSQGQSIASIDPLGRVTRTYLDALNRPAQVTRNLLDPANPEATLEQRLALATPPAYADASPNQNITTQTRYDDQGRTIASIDALGHIYRTYYDTLGRAYKTTQNLRDPNNPNATLEARLALSEPPAFDAAHPDWNITTESVYDVAGRTIASISAPKAGCTVTHQADGTVSVTAACDVTRTYYDALGRAYATVQHLTGQAITEAALPSSLDANPNNDPTTENNLIRYTLYDAAGQTLATLAPDPACEVQRGEDGSLSLTGACTLNRSYYDGLGRVVSTVQNLTGQDYTVPTAPERNTAVDAPPDQNVRQDTIYDAAGYRTDMIDAQGVVTHFAYDTQGRLTDVYENYRPGETASATVNLHMQYTYDAQGNRLTIRSAQAALDGTQNVTTFTYDKLSRQLTERDPLNHGVDYSYNLLGQRVTQTDAMGAVTSFIYDALGRLETIDYPDPDHDVVFTYDPNDLKKTMSDGQGATPTTWVYDDLGRVLSVTDPFQQTVQYAYNGYGQRAQLTYPDQKTVTYDYDPAGRLQQVLDWNARPTQYSYYANGQAHTVERPNEVTTTYTYDPLGRLVDLKHSQQNQTLGQYTYTYNLVGNRVRAEETLAQAQTPPSQFSVTAAGYMAIQFAWPDSTIEETGYRLERSTDNQQHWQQIAELPANTLRYTDYGLLRHTAYWYRLTAYNASTSQAQTLQTETGMDPVTEDEGTGSSVITYEYDRLNRLIEANYDNGQFFHYAYDANGNRLSETIAAGQVDSVYDAANRLISVGGVAYTWDNNGNLTGDGQSAYSYDHANRLTKIEQNGTTVSTYGYNGLGDRLTENSTQFVLDLNTGLTQVLADGTNTYLYGNERIGQYTEVNSAYFLEDALGSVRQLTDGSGTVTLAKSYEPYGEVFTSTGNGASIYGFTGEQSDLMGLIYLRARYYSDGRFLTRDTWQGDYRRPISANKWVYADSNPINLVDPSGQCSQGKGWNERSGEVFSKENCDMLENIWQNHQRGRGKEGDLQKMEDWYNQLADRIESNGAKQSAKIMRHFLEGSGSEFHLDDGFMTNDVWGWSYIKNKTMDLISWYSRAKGMSCDPIQVGPDAFARMIYATSPDLEMVRDLPSLDLFGALGTFRIDAEIGGMLEKKSVGIGSSVNAKLAVHIVALDIYDFHKDQPTPVVDSVSLWNIAFNSNPVPDDWALLLNQTGLAKSFLIRGDMVISVDKSFWQLFDANDNPPDPWYKASCIGAGYDNPFYDKCAP